MVVKIVKIKENEREKDLSFTVLHLFRQAKQEIRTKCQFSKETNGENLLQ